MGIEAEFPLIDYFREGVGKMKPVTGLTPEETASVIAYMRTLKEQ